MSVSENENFHQARKAPVTKTQTPGKRQYPKVKGL